MNIEELRTLIISKQLHSDDIEMYFILKKDNNTVMKSVDIGNSEIPTILSRQFLNFLNFKIIENTEINLVDISSANEKKKTIFYYDLEEKPVDLNFFLNEVNRESVSEFSFTEDNLDDLFGYVFRLGTEENNIKIFKKHYPISLMKRDSMLSLLKADTRFVKLDQDIIKLTDSFDFLIINNSLIILNVDVLERYFGFSKIIHNIAREKIQLISNANLLMDIEPLVQFIVELKYAKKIMRLRPDSPVLNLEFNKIKHFIQNHPKLKKKIRFNEIEDRISLDTKISTELFLKMLDDDYLKSELTDLLYESDDKNRLIEEDGESE